VLLTVVHLPLFYDLLKPYVPWVRRIMLVKKQILWDITSCEMVNINRRFGRYFWHHFQGLCTPKDVLVRLLKPQLQNQQTFPSDRCVFASRHDIFSYSTWINLWGFWKRKYNICLINVFEGMTFIIGLTHSIIQNLEVKIYVV
jgi:hypothetical protein